MGTPIKSAVGHNPGLGAQQGRFHRLYLTHDKDYCVPLSQSLIYALLVFFSDGN